VTRDWRAFVLAEGRGAHRDGLARVLGQPAAAIDRVRATGACQRGPRRDYGGLFTRWHGRAPREDEWPAPHRAGGGYVWHPPELTLLATMVGRLDARAIACALTQRLQRLTGDPSAHRSLAAVQAKVNHLGLQATDVVGGLTVAAAAADARVGSQAIVQHAIRAGHLPTRRVGRLHVIPREAFQTWLADRDAPPDGWVRLTTLRQPLGIRSDAKLPECASCGYIPDVVFVRSTRKWFIKPETAAAILDDARQGRPLPWHGAPLLTNVWSAWCKWQRRRHRDCDLCRAIWGAAGAPTSLETFVDAWLPLDLGQKRHLTLTRARQAWRPRQPWGTHRAFRGAGVTIREAARQCGRSVAWVHTAIARGVCRPVRSTDAGAPVRITPAGLRALQAVREDDRRGRPPGVWLGPYAAARHAGVAVATILRWVADRGVASKAGPRGRLVSQASLQRRARRYWATCRFTRAARPAWLAGEVAA
jgi:hypothetical protein